VPKPSRVQKTKNKQCGSCILTTKCVTLTNYYDKNLIAHEFFQELNICHVRKYTYEVAY